MVTVPGIFSSAISLRITTPIRLRRSVDIPTDSGGVSRKSSSPARTDDARAVTDNVASDSNNRVPPLVVMVVTLLRWDRYGIGPRREGWAERCGGVFAAHRTRGWRSLASEVQTSSNGLPMG